MLLPEAGGKQPTRFQASASGTRQEILELCNPSNSIGQAHLYNWRPAKSDWEENSTILTSSQNQNEWGINRSNLLQDSGKHSFSVHIKVNTFNLTEDMQVLPNLMKHEKLEVQTVVSAYLHTSMANVEKYKLIPGHWSYKIAKLAPFLFSSLLLPSRSLQTRKADCYPQLKISKEYEWLTTTIIPAWPEIMPSWLILFNLDGMQAPQHHTCLSICFCCFFFRKCHAGPCMKVDTF